MNVWAPKWRKGSWLYRLALLLHNISGFDSSIVIDRPLAMVSGKTREYIAKVLSKISDERQILLLLTPEDYGSDVSGILDVVASSKMKWHCHLTKKN